MVDSMTKDSHGKIGCFNLGYEDTFLQTFKAFLEDTFHLNGKFFNYEYEFD